MNKTQPTPEEITAVVSEQPDLYQPTVQPLDAVQDNGYFPIEVDAEDKELAAPSLAKLATPSSDKNWLQRFKVAAKTAVSNIMNAQMTHNVALGNKKITLGKNKEEIEFGRRMASEAKRQIEEVMDGTEELTAEEAESWAAALGGGSVSMVDFAANLALLRGLGVGSVGAQLGAGWLAGRTGYEEGTMSDIDKYIAETGDKELKNYKGDKKAFVANVASGTIQGSIESATSGLGRYLINNPLAKKVLGKTGNDAIRKMASTAVGRTLAAGANESVNNAFEEWTQALTGNIAEIVKGNEEFSMDNILNGAGQAAGVGALLGWVATPVMQEYGRRKTRDWISDKLRKASEEKGIPLTETEIKDAANDLVGVIESKGVQQVSDNYEKINQLAGAESDLAQTLTKVFEDLVNQGQIKFRQATPDEIRQAGLDWANYMQATALLDSLDREIPISAHPLFNAVAEADRIFLEGRDPATGDLLPLDINNAQVRELANQIEDYIEQNRETRQAEEASKLVALREADMRARQETIQELERAAIAELEKEQAEKNQERITELQQQITELQHQMDLLREERSQYVKERAAQGRISIGRAKAQTAPDNKALTKKAIRSGNLDIITQILQDNGFKTRDLSGTQIKQMAQLNWEKFAGRDLGMAKSKYDQSVAMKAIEQNVVSGDTVLLRAGYTQGQIDQMDDKTWNRALLAAYREETEALESAQQQLTPEQLAQIPDDMLYQDTPFDLAAENARLDDIYPEYKGETINIDGKERTVYNSNGERIAKSEQALRNFWNWFGDSKVVDDQGRPLVVYHGSKINNLEILDSSLGDSETYGSSAGGTYFTSNYSVAMTYMRDANAKEIKEIPENNIVLLEYGPNLYEIDSKTGNFTGRIFNQDGWSSRQYKLSDETGTPDLSWYKKPMALVILNKNLKSIAGIRDYNFNGEDYIKQAKQLISDLDSEETGKIYPVYLKIKKPLVLDFEGESFNGDFYDGMENIIRAIKKKRLKGFDYNFEYEFPIQALERYAKEHNYDSLIVKNVYDNASAKSLPSVEDVGDDFVVFEPNQIKSTENTGEFGIGVNNMYHQDQVVENPVLLDLGDITSDIYPYEVLNIFQNSENPWGELIDPVKYKNALLDFVKNGVLLRTDTADIESWFETIVRNTTILNLTTDLYGHSPWFPLEEVKEYFFGEDDAAYQKFLEDNNLTEEKSDWAIGYKILEANGMYEKMVLPDGSDAVSDYGLQPLLDIIYQYKTGMSAEQVLVLINKALDVYHQRGDLASAFIKGGAETAEKISNDYPLDNMMQYQPGYVSLPVPEMIGGKFDKSDKLVVSHGISLNSINKALALGGLPSPSIAISKASDPLTDFGTIKLVGTKEMIDPENEQNLVYDRDIWSAMFPRPVYKNATKTASDKFRDKFRNAFIKADEEDLLLNNILYLALNSANPGQVVDMFANSFGAQIYYLEHILGKTIDVPMTERYDLKDIYFLKPDQRFIDEVAKIDINESYDAWKGTFRKAANDLIAREGVEDRYQNIISRVYEYYDDLSFPIAVRMVQDIKNYAQNNGLKVNRMELQYLLDAYNLYGDKNYEKWASEQTESLLGEPKIKVGNKKLDWTLDNITKAMIQKSVVNSATGGYSIGNIIAAGGKKLESLEEIKSEGRKLKTKADSEAETDSIGRRITEFASDILKQFEESGNSTFGSFFEDVYMALVKAANLRSITESTLNNLLNKVLEPKERINFDKEVLKEGVKFTKEISGLTRYFFEAKPQRSVRFEEFVGAIVPPDALYDEVAANLVGRGLVVIRTDDIKGGVEAIEQIKQGTVFQNKKTSKSTTGLGAEHRGGYDPMTKAIIFNKTSDLTTLFHESAHYWFDRNLRYYRTGLASPEWKKKWEDVMNELGATPNARGTIPVSAVRSASEKFARSMEAYLREGKYESAAIQWAHQDYANMVKRVYRNIWATYWGLNDLSPAVKQWFDMFGLKTDDATTAFAEEDKIETDEQMVGAVVAEDATKPDVDAETKTIVADAGAQVVENPATQEIAVVPADPFETGKKARSKLPRSAEAATGVSMDDIIYNRRSMSDAFKAAQQLVNTDPVRAWEILKGGQEMVDGLYAGDIYRALIAKYQAENNPTMLKNVVQAFAGAARRAGRSVKAFDLESPRISFEKTINSLDKIFDTKKNDKRIEKVKNELKEFLHDPSALRVGWEEFKNIVGCK